MEVTRREQLAWAAGVFDGEGNIACTNSSKALILQVGQSHMEMLNRLREIFKIGKIYGPYPRGINRRPHWNYSVNGPIAQAVVAMIYPFLGSVKQEQCRHAIGIWKSRKYKWQHCLTLNHEVTMGLRHECLTCKPIRRRRDYFRTKAVTPSK